MNKKTCKYCKQRFTPIRSFQPNCLETVCIEANNEKIRANQKKEGRKRLKAFNMGDVAVLKRKAQTAFNAYIRARDAKQNCISCDHNFTFGRQRHAGHYRPQGGHSLLRYDERNVHVQCSICNNHKSGNLADYRLNLIKKIGLAKVEELETMDTMKRWTAEELQEIIDTYKSKLKELN